MIQENEQSKFSAARQGTVCRMELKYWIPWSRATADGWQTSGGNVVETVRVNRSTGLNNELFSPVGTDAFNFNAVGIPASGVLTGQDCCQTRMGATEPAVWAPRRSVPCGGACRLLTLHSSV
jgi:hypothetical protein